MKKNNTLNFFKFIACVMIILIHCKFPGSLGLYTSSLARFAVPFFFLISGYYSNKDKDVTEYTKRHIVKLTKIAGLASFFYFMYFLISNIIYGDIKHFISSLITLNNFNFFLLYNSVPNAGHLWFLFAIIYVYFIYLLLNKNKKTLYFAAPFLLIYNIIANYLSFIFTYTMRHFFTRNFLFLGLPFFMIGNFINKYENKIKKYIKNKHIIIIFIVSSITSILESRVLGHLDLYISSIFLTISIFLLCINNIEFIKENNILANIGEKYSLGIYISHYMIYLIINKILINRLATNIIFQYLYPIIIILLTVLIVILYYKIKDIILNKSNIIRK